MKALALRALVGYDEIEVAREELTSEATGGRAVAVLRSSQLPFGSGLVDRCVRAFGLACTTIDAVAGNVDRHGGRENEESIRAQIYGTKPFPSVCCIDSSTTQQLSTKFVLCTPLRNFNTILILSMILCVSSHAFVEPPIDSTRGTISGFVEDAISKEPLIGATISVKGIKAGAYTNKSGYFSISNVPVGQQTVVVSYVGYIRKEVQVTIPKGSGAKLRVALTSDTARGREVTVTAERDEDKRQISISRVNIPIEQLSQLRIGGEADVFRAL
ncbi:MAG: hypothetical protein RIR53_1843, partial [Bacteroidota bacterium]